MADGNIGNLWMQLGIQETVSDGLKKVIRGLHGADDETKRLRKNLKEALRELDDKSFQSNFDMSSKVRKAADELSKVNSEADALARTLHKLDSVGGFWLEGKFDDRQLSHYLEILRDIQGVIKGTEGYPGNMVAELSNRISQLQSFLGEYKSLVSKQMSWGKMKGFDEDSEYMLKSFRARFSTLRKEFGDLLKSGEWNGEKGGRLSTRVSALTTDLLIYKSKAKEAAEAGSTLAQGTNEATEALKRTETQAAKTAAAVENLGKTSKSSGAKDVVGGNGEGFSNRMLNALRSADLEQIGIKNATVQGKEFWDVLNIINKKLKEISGKEDGEEVVKTWRSQINNALKYLDILQRLDIKEQELSSLKQINPNVNSKKLEEAQRIIENFRTQITGLEKEMFRTGVDNNYVLGDYEKGLRSAFREIKQITDAYKKENPLSAFSGGFAKVSSEISKAEAKISTLRTLMFDGWSKGLDTGTLAAPLREMEGVLTRLTNARGNEKFLTDAQQMKNLLSDVAETTSRATARMTEYRNAEKNTKIAGDLPAQEYSRQKRQQELSKRQQEEELRAIDELGQRYMALKEAKRKAEEDAYKRGDYFPFLKMEAQEAQALSQRLAELSRLKADMQERDRQATEHGVFVQMQQEAQEAQALSQRERELLRLREVMIRRNDDAAAAEKRLADAIARANQARRESVSASRSQAESLVSSRIKDLEAQRQQLQALFGSGKSVMSADELNQVRAAFSRITQEINILRAAMNNLGSYSIGELFSMGRGTSNYSPMISDMERVVKEKREALELERKHQIEIAKTASKVRDDLASALKQANNQASEMGRTMSDLKSLFLQGGLVYGAQQFAMSIIQTGGELERQHIALQSILGDMQNADTMFGQIKNLALESPFTFSELNKDVKQLAAYGVEYDDLYDTTKRLADMASGLGVSFERIALAFGQVQARGWLDGKELRQISYAGIPLLDKLSKMYSKREGQKVSTSEVKSRISNRGVSFEDVKSVFWEMTDAGGQFYNMQQVLSETLLGRYNKLKDAWEIMLSEFASGKNVVGGTFMVILDAVTALVQKLHVLAPVAAAAFSGFAIKKVLSLQGGGVADSLLAKKTSMAKEYKNRLISGEQLTSIERQILDTKNRITSADLRQMAISRELTRNELNRLRISGAITAEQYRTYSAILKQQAGHKTLAMEWARMRVTMRNMSLNGIWKNFATSATASFGIIKAGARSLGATLWSAIGGLPGLIITGVTSLVTYFISKNEELKNEMATVANELKDRFKSINELQRDMPVMEIVAKGDTKEIDNAIEAYKEKIKQIAPYSYNNLVMSAEERSSHEERLAYLADELHLIQRANEVAQHKLGNSSVYKDLKSGLEDLVKSYDSTTDYAENYKSVDEEKRRGMVLKHNFAYKTFADNTAQKIRDVFGDISKDKRALSAAQQAMTSIMAQMEIPEDKANVIRASVLQSFGIVDGWLEGQVASKMTGMISSTAPVIANKIRSGQKLNQAEQEKVKELMAAAKQDLIYQYPELERTLQNLLASSHFKAVIDLVVNDVGAYGDVQKTMSERIPGMLAAGTRDKYIKYVNSWGSSDSWYDARNNAKAEIDRLYNNLTAAKRSNAKNIATIQSEYNDAVSAAKTLLNYDYTGEDKKSNKNKDGKNKEDTALKAWEERLSSYKSARQTYQKYKQTMGYAEAKRAVEKLYDNIGGLDLENYAESIKKLEGELDFTKSPERKKALTSLRRELADWHFSEELKPEFDRIASDFTEALEKGASQFSLYKTLLEKSGSKDFASMAFQDGALWDDEARNMAERFKEMTGMEPDIDATDATAKHYLVDVKGNQNAYSLWKKLTDHVKGEYTDALTHCAEIISETMGYEERIVQIQERYNKLIEEANRIGDKKAATAYRQKRDKEVGAVNLEKFKNSEDYMNFYSAVTTLGMKKAHTIANKIRNQLNKALRDGAIDARQYGKEIEELRKKLDELSEMKPSFLNGGLNGVKDRMQQKGQAQYNAGQNKLSKAQEDYRVAELANDVKGMASAKDAMSAGQSMMDGGEQLMNGASEMQGTIGLIDKIIHGINDLVQGMNDTFQDIKETADALGQNTDSDEWEDYNTFFSSFSNASNSATKGWDSLKEGNMGGVISGVVGSFTGWIKGFAQGHDKKLDNQIKIAERQEKLLQNIYDNTNSIIEKTLGGIYNFQASEYTKSGLNSVISDYEKRKSLEAELNGTKSNGAAKNILGGSSIGSAIGAAAGPVGAVVGGVVGGLVGGIKSLFSSKKSKLKKQINKLPDYSDETYAQAEKALRTGTAYDTQLASLMAQKDQLQKKRDAESAKKKSDADKIADYDKEIEDMRLQIQTFAQDFLKSIYSIDMKSWASELTDAVVSAWSAGEDAIDAYKEKVRDLVKDLTKNILSQKIMEAAMQEPLNYLTGLLEEKGQLDEGDMDTLATKLYKAGEDSVQNITGILDALKKKGLDLSDDSSSSSSTNSIKSITEETADLLAAYLNAIRLDLSAHRANVQKLIESLSTMPALNEIASGQLAQLTTLVSLAQERNSVLVEMNEWMKAVSTSGRKKIYVS